MDSAVIFALALAVLFFGGVTWLIIHTRRQERADRARAAQPAPAVKAELRKTGTD
jgi:cbb3-type cytochrome oxidase subunit 3